MRVRYSEWDGEAFPTQDRLDLFRNILDFVLAYGDEALRALDEERADAPELASLAKARCADTYFLVGNEAIQMHGGIGVTDESEIGFFLKRARVAQMTLGDAAYHRDRFARLRGF